MALTDIKLIKILGTEEIKDPKTGEIIYSREITEEMTEEELKEFWSSSKSE